jgi:hypothetical protein
MQTFTLDHISVYIFSWKKVTDNSLKLYKNISPIIKNTTLINCDEKTILEKTIAHVQLDDTCYYGSQYNVAIKRTNPTEILCIIVGDNIADNDFKKIFESAINTFNKYDVGIYAPNDKRTWHQSRNANIANELYDVDNTDCGFWFIHPAIIKRLKPLNYRISNYGWGIDTINIQEAKKQGRLVIRDYSIETDQLDHTCGYNQDKAKVDSEKLLKQYNRL